MTSRSARLISKLTEATPEYWRSQGDEMMAKIAELEAALEKEYPELQELHLDNRNGALGVAMIRVKPEFRNQGVGGRVIHRLKQFAAEESVPIVLSPEADRGYKDDLHRFYRRRGFYRNFGRRADSRYTSVFAPTMIWKPPVK